MLVSQNKLVKKIKNNISYFLFLFITSITIPTTIPLVANNHMIVVIINIIAFLLLKLMCSILSISLFLDSPGGIKGLTSLFN